MQLILDLQTLQSDSRHRGIGRYSDGLARAIAIAAGHRRVMALQNAAMPVATGKGRAMLDGLIPGENVSVFAGLPGTRGIVAQNRWRAAASDIVRDLHIERLLPDVVHVASPFEGFGDDTVVGCSQQHRSYTSVATVYDLIVFEDHEVHLPTALHRDWFEARLERLRNTDLILAISEHTRGRIIERLGLRPERVVTIMGDTSSQFRRLEQSPAARAAVLRKYGISKPYVMHTGILETRKNVVGLVKAFSQLPSELRNTHQLVLAAAASEHQRDHLLQIASQAGLDPSVLVFAGYVPDEDLVGLYNGCRLLAFPSFAEGLGLPPLEAMRCGSVAIGAATTSTAEVIGDRELLFDPNDGAAFAKLLHRLLKDDDFYAAKRASCWEQQRSFSWERSASIALAAIDEACARHRAEGSLASDKVPNARVYLIGGQTPQDFGTALARQPGILMWEAGTPTQSVSPSRELRYRLSGYRGLLTTASLDARTLLGAAPGALASLCQQDFEKTATAVRRAFQTSTSVTQAIERGAEIIRLAGEAGGELAVELANAMADGLQQPLQPRLFIDVSELAKRDARSGVQRVTRNILSHMLRCVADRRVEPVYEHDGAYRYARAFTAKFLDQEALEIEDGVVDFQPDDTFLGLDLNILISDTAMATLERHRRRGLRVWFVVYDLLPLLMPECFHAGLRHPFHRWFGKLASVSDGVVAISRSVADEILLYLDEIRPARTEPLLVCHFNLGGDLDGQAVPSELRDMDTVVLSAVKGKTYFLKVGTLEPRKGHGQLLDAFELLWASGSDVCLVLVGKAGWLNDDVIARVETHPENGERLFWLASADDHVLDLLYADATAVIQSSYGEGYGLPLVEASRHGKPIIARDIPVFREIADGHATFFPDTDASALAETVATWMQMRPSEPPISSELPWISWQRSAAQLEDVLKGREPYRQWQRTDMWLRTPIHPDLTSETGALKRGTLQADATEGIFVDLPIHELDSGTYELEIEVEASAGSGAQLEASWRADDKNTVVWTVSPETDDPSVRRRVVIPRMAETPRLTLTHRRSGRVTLRAILLRPYPDPN